MFLLDGSNFEGYKIVKSIKFDNNKKNSRYFDEEE
jgi:hypothetical protein